MLGSEQAQLSSSSYESLNFAKDDMLVISTLRAIGVTEITEKYQASSLASYSIWRKKFCIGKDVEILRCQSRGILFSTEAFWNLVSGYP